MRYASDSERVAAQRAYYRRWYEANKERQCERSRNRYWDRKLAEEGLENHLQEQEVGPGDALRQMPQKVA